VEVSRRSLQFIYYAIRCFSIKGRTRGGGIFGPKRHEVTGAQTHSHSEELHNLHWSPYAVKITKTNDRLARHVARTIKLKNSFKF
jgi:hypothetical protein